MVKNKNNAGRRLSLCKTKNGGSKITVCGGSAPLDCPPDSNAHADPPDTCGQSQLGFPDKVYLLASVIFQNNHLEKPAEHRLVNYGKERGLPLPAVKDEGMQRAAYELAFNTLKYQELLEDMIIDSCLCLSQPMPDHQMSLVAIMLCDFQDRKFLPRRWRGKEEIIKEVRDVEMYLLRLKTKLAASLARCRIKHDLLSIECILPESVKQKQERSRNLPLYAWVNTLKSSLDEVQSVLKSAGFSQVKSIGQLEGQTFCQDPHCRDTLVFPAQLKVQLCSTRLLSDHKLIVQDKSRSLVSNTVRSLLPEEGDVLMVGYFSGLTVSHTASLIAEKGNSNNQHTVYVCVSNCTDAQTEELHLTISAMGCKNRDLLLDLAHASIAQSKLESLVAQQRKDIDHALKFPKVLAVVYSTCSSYPEENVNVVSSALERAKARSDQKGEPKKANFRPRVSPFSSSNHAVAADETDSFFMLEPSEINNGCFLAVLDREPEPLEGAQDVIARANARGLLDKIGSSPPTRKEHNGHPNRTKKASRSHPSPSHLPASIPSKTRADHQTKGSNSVILCGHREFTNVRQSSQGRQKALSLQTLRTSVSSSFSYSKRECASSSSPSASKQASSAPPESLTPEFDTTPVAASPHPAALPASPVAPAVRPRRAPQEVLKPVLLVLPPVHFPTFFPPHHSQRRFSPGLNYNKWKTPDNMASLSLSLSRSSGGLSKDALDKPHPFSSHTH
ncbi:putative methyltransferase NSUN7 isoform X2 [Mugil cephalus]|uniref:putative methyltransferase NSUN7 isoform X2 n=1 Tax=Mugil cephalus TaxID=48193 RepID=UPI001FB61B1A|nr:putative methyltransferase NSUN7 isoform X2 [Mugil cephalus]